MKIKYVKDRVSKEFIEFEDLEEFLEMQKLQEKEK